MTRVPAHLRAEIVRLRQTGLSYDAIAQLTGVSRSQVGNVCRDYYGGLVANAKTQLAREIALARSERHTAPLFHPEQWG